MFLDLLQGKGQGSGTVRIAALFLGLLLRGNVEKRGNHQEKKFFIDNAVQALIPFKEKHRGLLKLHVQLGEGVSVWQKKEGIFFELEK